MAKTTVSFTIEETQLSAVDALADRTKLNRSVTLGMLIEAGMQAVQSLQAMPQESDRMKMYASRVASALERGPLPVSAFQNADADAE